MAKGPYLTDDIKRHIGDVYLQNPQIKPTAARSLVLDWMREKGLDKIFGRDFPRVSTVSKVLKDFRDKDALRANSKDLDEPWDISSLGRHPIPQEALPVVLDVSMQSQQPLTIREAQWIGRLYGLLSTITSQQGLDRVPVDSIGGIAAFYATTERINELMGKRLPVDMDETLWRVLTKQETLESALEAYRREFQPGMKDDRWRVTESGALSFMLTKAELDLGRDSSRKLGRPRPFEDSIRDSLGITLEVKEDKDERATGQRQSTKAKRHR